MTDPNLMLWNQAIEDENWPEAERIRQLAEGIGPMTTKPSTQLEQLAPTQEVE